MGSGVIVDMWPDLDSYNDELGISEPQTYIYGLFEPATGALRYIGKSDRPRDRFANQLNERSNTHRCNWIQSLVESGEKPIQRILEHVPVGDGWQSVERAYIRGALAAGCRLVNGTAGGDGVVGLGPVARERIRSAWIGRKHSEESKRRIGAASRGRLHTDEYKQYMRDLMRQREFTPTHRQRLREANQKLTAQQVQDIRARLRAGERQASIAADYGINKGSVSNINRGVTYSGIGDNE